MAISIKEALYREIKYKMCGVGGVLYGLVSATRIKLDMRNSPTTKTDAEYPWIVFRRITESENNQVNYSRNRIEIEVIGLRSSATKGDDLLEQIKDIIKDYFKDQTRTWGQFTSTGTPDAATGLRMKGIFMNAVEGFNQDMDEKAHILVFLFTYLRS